MQKKLLIKNSQKKLQLLLALTTAILIVYLWQFPIFGQSQSNVIVDFAAPQTNTNSVSGILHGIDPKNPPDSKIEPLQPKLWRAGRVDTYDRVVKAGAEFQLIVSDLWGYGTNPKGWPYQNYPAWEDFVRQLARQNKGKKILWDIWNEPDWSNPFWAGTREQFFETYKRAYQVLRQELGPEAIIGGPSIAIYSKEYLTAFLNYCKANNLEVNFLSWHELNDNIILFVDDHLIEARRNFLQSPTYKSLKIKKIYVNEIIGEAGQYRPGDILGYFYYLERGQADGACRACWGSLGANKVSNCFNNTLAGMVTPDTFQPRAAWWAYKVYADGARSRVQSQSDTERVVALASKSTPSGKAQVLLGYFDRNYADSINVSITLRNLQQLGIAPNSKVNIKLEKIPDNQEKAVEKPVIVKEENVSIGSGTLRYFIPKVALHEAYILTIGK
ncbi:beta-xylosidase [Oscillatoriales cyanobacterium USR001]|nr:beta-xylosidase [Oscillatoriales cyanobacterium USR001]